MGVLGKEAGSGFIGYAAGRLADRLEGLTDDEYLWEPVPDCWTIRPGNDGIWRADLGPGGRTATPISPPPFTTIAWRLWHIGASRNPTWPPRARTAAGLVEEWFGQKKPQGSADAVGDVETARRLVTELWSEFAAAVSAIPDDDLLTVMGPVAGPFAESTVLGLILHIGDELVHHSAEVGVLRDLYARQ